MLGRNLLKREEMSGWWVGCDEKQSGSGDGSVGLCDGICEGGEQVEMKVE